MEKKPFWQRWRTLLALAVTSICAWSSRPPGGDPEIAFSPFGSPLSPQALDTASRASPRAMLDESAQVAAEGPLGELGGGPAQAFSAVLDEVPQPVAFAGDSQLAATQTLPVAVAVPSERPPQTDVEVRQLALGQEQLNALIPGALAAVTHFDAERTVQRFDIGGTSPLSQTQIDDALEVFLGTERNDDQLEAARRALQRAHDAQGHRVKVSIAKNQKRDGVARLDVRERKRYSMRVTGVLVYDPVTRRNVRAETLSETEEPSASISLSRKLSQR